MKYKINWFPRNIKYYPNAISLLEKNQDEINYKLSMNPNTISLSEKYPIENESKCHTFIGKKSR
jgi:hypothetical protein